MHQEITVCRKTQSLPLSFRGVLQKWILFTFRSNGDAGTADGCGIRPWARAFFDDSRFPVPTMVAILSVVGTLMAIGFHQKGAPMGAPWLVTAPVFFSPSCLFFFPYPLLLALSFRLILRLPRHSLTFLSFPELGFPFP